MLSKVLFIIHQRFKVALFTILGIMVFIFSCSDDDSDDEIKELLTTGIWELSEESDQGLIGAHFQFNTDGSGTVYFEGSLFFEFQWILEDDNSTLVLTGSDNVDTFEIEELTKTALILLESDSGDKLIFFKVTD